VDLQGNKDIFGFQ